MVPRLPTGPEGMVCADPPSKAHAEKAVGPTCQLVPSSGDLGVPQQEGPGRQLGGEVEASVRPARDREGTGKDRLEMDEGQAGLGVLWAASGRRRPLPP